MVSRAWETVESRLSHGSWTDLLPVGVYACDLEGRLVVWNRQAEALWGRKPAAGDSDERFCGSFRLFLLDGTELPHAKTPMARVLETGELVRDETVVILRPDSSRIIVQVNIDPIWDEDGSLAGAVNAFQDVSEIYRARQQASEKERRLRTILEALPAAIYTTDAEGRVTFFNTAAARFAGREPQVDEDRWCITWKLLWPDGTLMEHAECPMAIALSEQRPLSGVEAQAERPDSTRVPFLAYPTPLFDSTGRLSGAVNMLVDITERKEAESAQTLLMNELDHRVKNTLATVQSIARQTMAHAESPEQFSKSFCSRLGALAAAHGIVTRQAWRGADLLEIIRGQLVLDDDDGNRLRLDGPEVTLSAQTALHLALVVHELGTNARKYGALSVAGGRVNIEWQASAGAEPALDLHWRETGGPSIVPPAARGFGSELIEKSLQAEGGRAVIAYETGGLRCDIHTPLAQAGGTAGAVAW